MQNPDKLQFIALGKDASTVKISIDDWTIYPSNDVKGLGVTIDKDLKSYKHICCRAARQINVLSKLPSVLDQEALLSIYRTFILSNFNYCPVVWHLCGIKCSQKMEKKNQETALRFVYKDYVSTYKELMATSNHGMLYISRIGIIAIEVYKALNELSPKYLQDMIDKSNCDFNLLASSPLTQPKCNTVSYGLNSVRYKGPKILNTLPNYIKETNSLPEN